MVSPNVSAVVVTYRRSGELYRCLDSLAQQTVRFTEVIVVDNGAALGDEAKLVCEAASVDMPVHYIAGTTNSLPAARNLGVSRCSGEFVALIDDDVRLAPDYLKVALMVFTERPEAVGVQGYIKPGSRPRWHEWIHRLFGLYHLEPDRCRVLPAISATYPHPLTQTVKCEWISGSNQVYRRDVLEEIRWDERLLKYADGEDLDHSFRVHRLYPGRLFISPEAEVWHDESAKARALGFELIAMREIYGWYLLHKLFPSSHRALFAYAWSRIGRSLISVAAAVTMRRQGAWTDLWSIVKAYRLVFVYRRDFAVGKFEYFNSHLDLDEQNRGTSDN